MDITKIEKIHLIDLWKNSCSPSKSIDDFTRIVDNDFPVLTIKLTTNVSVQLSKEDVYYIRLVFGGYINYKKSEISKEEFEELSILQENVINKKNTDIKKEIIKRGEHELATLMQYVKFETITTSTGEPVVINVNNRNEPPNALLYSD